MVDHDYVMTAAGLAVLAAVEALEEMAAYDAPRDSFTCAVDLYPTDADVAAHGS